MVLKILYLWVLNVAIATALLFLGAGFVLMYYKLDPYEWALANELWVNCILIAGFILSFPLTRFELEGMRKKKLREEQEMRRERKR